MALQTEDIEKFFEEKFEPMSPGPGLGLVHYDGFAYWWVDYIEKDTIFISAHREIQASPFPVVEVTVYCSHITTSHAEGVGPVLILHSNDTEDSGRCIVLTKTKAGRISLNTSVGVRPG
jgi:hypothetical protein